MKLIKDFDPSLAPSGVLDTKGVNPNEQLMLYNDSLNGMQLTFPDGSVDVIPPSWNKDFIIESVAMSKVAWKVYNTIPSTGYPISQVYGTIYEPGEHVARVNAGMQRGFQITGGAIAVGNTSVSNEGNPINTLFIDGGPVGNMNMIQIYNDHFIWNVVQSGVAHQVLKGNISGNPLQIGAVGDIAEMLGNAVIDGTLTVIGTLNVTGNTTLGNLLTSVITCGGGYVQTGGDMALGVHNITSVANVAAATMSTTGLANFATLQSGGYYQNAGDADIAGHKLLNVQQFKFNNGNLISGINCGSFNPGSTTGTIAHGLGSAPNGVVICTGDSVSTATCSAYAFAATTFSYHVVTTGIVYNWIAIKF